MLKQKASQLRNIDDQSDLHHRATVGIPGSRWRWTENIDLIGSLFKLNSKDFLSLHNSVQLWIRQETPGETHGKNDTQEITRFIKRQLGKPQLVWLNGLSVGLQTERLLVRFPVRACAWVVGQVPSRGCMTGNHPLMFLSSFSLPSPLKINK